MENKVRIEIPVDNYVKAKSASGTVSRHSGDLVGSTLTGLTLDETLSIAVDMLQVAESDLRAKYEHLNVGQQRMNLGNRIRGAVNKMNKAAEGSGDSYLTQIAEPFIVARDERAEAAVAEKAAKQAEKAAKAEAAAQAKAEKAAAKAAAKAAEAAEAAEQAEAV